VPQIGPVPDHSSDHHQGDLQTIIARLGKLQAGPCWLDDIMRHGKDALPALRTLLFRREPSGLSQARCQAAQALAALKAFDVLDDFLTCDRSIADPVERLGEDTVLSIAASLIARRGDGATFDLLMTLAGQKHLRGIIEGLGSFRRPESIPVLIDALAHDDLRQAAETALLGLIHLARQYLVQAACRSHDGDPSESESSLRQRRSALALLRDLRVSRQEWSHLRVLLHDPDRQISALACQIGIKVGILEERAWARAHLESLKAEASWLECFQIDQVLNRSNHRTRRLEKESRTDGDGID
jgi:hypothetical protein